MKKIIVLVALLGMGFSYGQNWKVREGGTPFDGKHKSTTVIGEGPLTDQNHPPTLQVLAYDSNKVVVIVDGIGGFGDHGKRLYWALDTEPNNSYRVASYDIENKDKLYDNYGNRIYKNTFLTINGFYYPKSEVAYFYPIELLDKMTAANNLYIRVVGSEYTNDYSFSLSGAANAINSMVSKSIRAQKISEIESVRNPILTKENTKNNGKQIMYDKFAPQIEQMPYNSIQKKQMLIRLNSVLEPGRDGVLKNYVSLEIVPDSPSTNYFEETGNSIVNIIDENGNKEQIGYNSMDMTSEIYKKMVAERAAKQNSGGTSTKENSANELKNKFNALKNKLKKKKNN